MEAVSENKNKYIALGLTLGIHALLFLLFLMIVFITPIPPFEVKPIPEIFADLGMSGMGNLDSGGKGQHDKDIATSPEKIKSTTSNNTAPNVVTDETETAVSIKKNPKNKKDTKVETPVVTEEKPSEDLVKALAAIRLKKEQKGKGKGDGTDGSGKGVGKGVGDGNHTGHGDDPYSMGNGKGGIYLTGRSLLGRADKMTDAQEEGTVYVKIVVDETGKVIDAIAGQRGTTTTSSRLFSKARQAAKQLKFNPSPDGTKEQIGTYIVVFSLE